MNNYSRTLSSFEARFSRGPADPTLHTCTACRYEVESVDSHGQCDECSTARIAAEADACGCDLCDADLAADEGFTAWCADRQLAAVEAMAFEVDAHAEALRARVAAGDHADDTDRNARHGATRFWTAGDAAALLSRRAVA